MKTVTILFAHKKSRYIFEQCFNGKSAFEMSQTWALSTKSEKCCIFASENMEIPQNQLIIPEIVRKNSWTIKDLVSESADFAEKNNAEAVVFAWADCPFLNMKLTNEIIETHFEYLAEYTYSEGYPYGFSPEVIDKGTLGILRGLCETTQKETGDLTVTRSSLFDLLKTDINAFEIETVLSDEDYRLFRYSFDTGRKETLSACRSFFKANKDKSIMELELEKVCDSASKDVSILKTVPGFYNIQLTSDSDSNPEYFPKDSPLNRTGKMETSAALKLIDDIAGLSENAVISLSYFGDPVKHPDFLKVVEKILSYPGLSVFVETDFIPQDIAKSLKEMSENACDRTNGYEKLMISINLDSATSQTFSKLRGRPEGDFEKTVQNIGVLSELLPGAVYPQFVRLNENENELETFYRYWNEKSNPSKGNLIIQKYNSFCKTLPDRKPADLSPVERNVCWHLRRDMNILSDGTVTFCHCLYNQKTGNVFEESLESIWKKMDLEIEKMVSGNLSKECGDCDEYYTFNF